jgi:hypothetical protein
MWASVWWQVQGEEQHYWEVSPQQVVLFLSLGYELGLMLLLTQCW